MKITKIETFSDRRLCVVRVTTDNGSEGYGQAAPSNADITATVLHRQVARIALGRDAADIDAFVDRAFEANYKFPWSYVSRAVGARLGPQPSKALRSRAASDLRAERSRRSRS